MWRLSGSSQRTAPGGRARARECRARELPAAQALQRSLIQLSIREVERREFTNSYGSGLIILSHAVQEPLAAPLAQAFIPDATPLERRISLVRGVGPYKEGRLRSEGYNNLAELVRHERYGKDALRVWTALAKREIPTLSEAGAKDVELLALFDQWEAAIVDIETVGLWQVLPVFLIGYARRRPDGWEIRQFFARGFEEEAAVLAAVSEELAEQSVCVTYNGKAFDEPFVRARLGLHGLPPVRFDLHVDLLHACRRSYGDALPNCRLGTVARHLFGMEREDDVPGRDVPDLYYQFVRDGAEEFVEPILWHNALDLVALATLTDATFEALAASAHCESSPFSESENVG